MDIFSARANGKLLLCGEYLVLKGAKAFSLPTLKGQVAHIKQNYNCPKDTLLWQSFLSDKSLLYNFEFDSNLNPTKYNDYNAAFMLSSLLKKCCENTSFKDKILNSKIETHLEFDKNWGLGSSSTLICLLSKLSGKEAFDLVKVFGGSGYDVAQAFNDNPITYRIANSKPFVEQKFFNPPFKENLFFVYTGRKQDTKVSISDFMTKKSSFDNQIKELDQITDKIIACDNLSEFEFLIKSHEDIISSSVGLEKVKQALFKDYDLGQIKSLGAWGGDFILASGEKKDVKRYFSKKNLDVFSFEQMILDTTT